MKVNEYIDICLSHSFNVDFIVLIFIYFILIDFIFFDFNNLILFILNFLLYINIWHLPIGNQFVQSRFRCHNSQGVFTIQASKVRFGSHYDEFNMIPVTEEYRCTMETWP